MPGGLTTRERAGARGTRELPAPKVEEELGSQSQCGGSQGWTASPRHETTASSQVSATQLTF